MFREASCPGQIQLARVAFQGSILLLAGLILGLVWDPFAPRAAGAHPPLVVYCAAGIKGLAAEAVPLARMTPVLAVRKGNPHQLYTLDDLRRGQVKVAQTNPDAAAVAVSLLMVAVAAAVLVVVRFWGIERTGLS